MNKIRKRKLGIFLLFASGLSIAFALIIFSLRQNLNVFVTPTELTIQDIDHKQQFRLGGMVKPLSVKRGRESIAFIVTDFKHDIPVTYSGMLPDLFREGSGVIVEGRLTNNGFLAANVLAKHDEKYMPRSIYNSPREKAA